MNIFQNTKDFILDTLFPITCLSCSRGSVWLCDDCLQKIEPLSVQVCPECEDMITDGGRVCRNCRFSSALDGLLVAAKYKGTGLDRLVHLHKYRFIEDLRIPLGKILTEAILQSHLPIPDIIIPIPLHPRRLRWRGFNQSQLLADYISRNLAPGFEIPLGTDILRRKRYTPPQMKIKKYAERLDNLQNAFVAGKPGKIKDKTVLLVDDIATTGATLSECAKELKRNGAKKVFGAVLARQEIG
ncbi:MAG: phosphoribosyltransferase family protein [Candidatus Moranbacteria bacterium]|nr:phosphoribosyltransferase family protein [Candidatus Moranbacteria bacterium]